MKKKILIIEPNQGLETEIIHTLRVMGTDLTLVHSHFKALTMLEDQSFSVVLVAAEDSGLDGLEFCRIYRKRQVKSGRNLPYLILLAQEWQRVSICESQADAHDFIIRPFLGCELEWRITAGLRVLREMNDLREMIYLDPETGVLNQEGLQRALREEINRLGRKKAWLSVAVLDFANRDWMEISQGKETLTLSKKRVLRFLKQTLRKYDQVAKFKKGKICIISGDCDHDCFNSLLKRIDGSLKKLEMPLPDVRQKGIDFSGIYQSMIIDSTTGGSEKCFEHLWNWINSIDRLPERVEARISLLDNKGLRDLENA